MNFFQEQEARLNLLRENSQLVQETKVEQPPTHFNLFQKEEDEVFLSIHFFFFSCQFVAIYLISFFFFFSLKILKAKYSINFAKNEEYEAEMRAKKRKEEAFLIKYLGEGSSEFAGKEPWYHKKREVPTNERVEDEIIKEELDPLVEMNAYLEKGKKKSEKEKKKDPVCFLSFFLFYFTHYLFISRKFMII